MTLAIALSPGEASACLCESVHFVRPSDGAQDVPVSAHLLIGGHGPATLVDAGGGMVALDIVNTWQADETPIAEYAPRVPLAAGTTYVVRADLQDLAMFETSDGIDDTAPPPPVIESMRLAFASRPGMGDCVPTREQLDVAATYAADVVAVQIKVLGEGSLSQEFPLPIDQLSVIGGPDEATCRIATALVAGQSYCLEFRARDLSGNLSGASRQCSEAVQCDAVTDSDANLASCNPSGCCSAGGRAADVAPVCVLVVLALGRKRLYRARPLKVGSYE